MHCLVAFATNSGSTLHIAERIFQTLLFQGQTAKLQEIRTMSPQDFDGYDLIVVGSPSWDYNHLEGQPHQAFFDFFEKYPDTNWSGKKFVLFGLGDRTFVYFCGAVDVLKEEIVKRGGEVVAEPLRINRFYFNDQQESYQQAEEWIGKVVTQITG